MWLRCSRLLAGSGSVPLIMGRCQSFLLAAGMPQVPGLLRDGTVILCGGPCPIATEQDVSLASLRRITQAHHHVCGCGCGSGCKRAGMSSAVLSGSPDSGRIACGSVGSPPLPASSTYAISTFETIDDDGDDGQYCDAEEPVALNRRRWGRLFGCLRLGCADGGLKSGDRVES